ncbi:MAG: uracil-DNA glycosylase [Candidatus Marinimicrobia bacterium CG08_land_8_20_14_0_20_45_22]|nr:MAG: uracil-DNA glycosylase [Candidatus Marinimicrobia bacterium CG08_land_8_20_14_0_20_45_22]
MQKSEVSINRSKQKLLDSLNQWIRSCTKCRLSDTRAHVLVGEGNPNARFMLIALSPGEKENLENKMFVGPSGQVLDMLFKTIGIERNSVYMTNLIKCLLPKNRRPKMDEIEFCTPYLDEEISIISPEIIVPLGYYATRSIFAKYSIDVPDSRREFSDLYGKFIFQEKQKFLPLPHPASLLYDPSFKNQTIEQNKKLQVLSRDCKWYPVCPIRAFYEQGQIDQEWVQRYCKGDWESCVRYKMEESGIYHPDWMLPDGSIDEKLKGSK